MPKISVYMPNHNYADYIDQAIDSVIRQTIDDWELIVIDDGSTDGSLERLSKYRNDDRITIIEQENKGLNVTNNVAIRLSRGKYIVRVDADDYIDENFLLVLSNTLETNPDIGLVFPDYYHVDKTGAIIETIRRKKIGEEAQLLDLPAHGACTMFRKDVLLEVGSYDEAFSCQDGYDIWIKFIEKYKPYNVNIPLFYYRQHGNNLTGNTHRILDTRREIKRKHIEKSGGLKSNILGLIPVYNASIYHQNRPFTELHGKPLLWYTLHEACKAQSLTRIAVTSEDDSVLEYVKENFPQVDVVKREGAYAKYDIRAEDLMSHALSALKNEHSYESDAVCLLYISTPLRQAKHIDHAADTMKIFDTDSVISVQEELAHCYHHDKHGLIPINIVDGNKPRLERQAIYKENSAVLLCRTKNLQAGNMLGKVVGHISMLPEESVKINSDFEFWLAEKVISNRTDRESKN